MRSFLQFSRDEQSFFSSTYFISDTLSHSFADRLVDIKENHKFRKHPKEGHAEKELGCGLQRIIAEIKEQYGLKYDLLLEMLIRCLRGASQSRFLLLSFC